MFEDHIVLHVRGMLETAAVRKRNVNYVVDEFATLRSLVIIIKGTFVSFKSLSRPFCTASVIVSPKCMCR